MTIGERLNDYEHALFLYRISLFLPSSWFKTNWGFCYFFYEHFLRKRGYNFYSFSIVYPEMEMFKPEYKEGSSLWWYKRGDIKSRVEHLKKTIKYTRSQC